MTEGEQPRIVDVDGMELHLDPDPEDPGQLRNALPPRLESWRRRSAAGAILTGIGLGLKAALEPEREEPSIIMQASGGMPNDLSVEAELGGILPADNVVKIRPWLLGAPADPATGAAGDSADPEALPSSEPPAEVAAEAPPLDSTDSAEGSS